MPIYAVRVNDGSCLIGEADSAMEARGGFLARWDTSGLGPEEMIISIRELPRGSFLSRWWPTEQPEDDVMLPGQLSGNIDEDSDVYEHEYPLIVAAHKGASDAISGFSDSGPLGSTLNSWDRSLREELGKAIRAEMRRGGPQNDTIQ